ncbi:MAG TPA: carboxypeptidase-like regulatory domain-containing protein [Planctomycetota bacterium]|nr:carboxypeptidase-like regulatory domain-containing protein [Planctomycetota bacterium]
MRAKNLVVVAVPAAALGAFAAWVVTARRAGEGPDPSSVGSASTSAGAPVPTEVPADVPGSLPAEPPPERQRIQPFPFEKEGPPDPRERRAEWTASIAGRLAMKDGSLVPANAFVAVLTGIVQVDFAEPPSLDPRSFFPLHREAARPDGTFEIPVPPSLPRFRFAVESDFAVYAGKDWFVLDSSRVREGVVLELEPAGRIEGTVRVPDGMPPVHGRVVFFVERPWDSTEPWLKGGVADASGRFAVGGIPPGVAKASALADGCAPAEVAEIGVKVRETARADFDLAPQSFIAGRVIGPSGPLTQEQIGRLEPVEAGRAFLFRGFALAEFQTERGGAFRVENLPPGPLRVSILSSALPRTEVASKTVVVPPGAGVGDLELTLASGRFLAGRVVDEFAKPAAKARVYVRTENLDHRTKAKFDNQVVQSAGDGSFLVSSLGDGPFSVEASGVGRGVAEEDDVQPDTQGIELGLPGPTGFAGVLLDETTGKPVPRFDVNTSVRWKEREKVPREGGHGRFDDEGRFLLADLRAGVHDATFRAEGYVEARLEGIEVRTGEILRGLEVKMRRAATLRGTVVDAESGQPVAGARVIPVSPENATRAGAFGIDKNASRADGSFELTDVVPGKVRLEATHPAYPKATGEEIEVSSGQALEGLVVRLARGGGLEGIVPGEGGRPWIGAEVGVFPEIGRSPFPGSSAVTDSTGYFAVGGLDPGRYRVRAKPPRGPEDTEQSRMARAQIAFATVEPGRTAKVEFPGPAPGCTLVGRILRGEEGVSGVRVVLEPVSLRAVPDGFPWEVETGKGGSFKIRHAPFGEATLSVWGNGDDLTNAAFSIEVPEAPQFVVLLRLPAGEVSGRVVRAWDGSPLEGAHVGVHALKPSADPKDLRRPTSTRTGPDGRYRLQDLAPGAYEIAATGGGTTDAVDPLAQQIRGPVEVVEGSPAEVDFELSVGGRARVVVVDIGGRLVEGARVNVVPFSGATGIANWSGYGRTGKDGTALVKGLATGRRYARASGPDFSCGFSEEREVRAGEEAEFRVEIGAGARVRVRLADERGERVDGGCFFTDARGRTIGGTPVAEGLREEVGAIVATLPFGGWTARAMAFGHEEESRALRLEPGGPVEITIRLQRFGSR